eukprot:764165-Hanusia_phi.AAC.2
MIDQGGGRGGGGGEWGRGGEAGGGRGGRGNDDGRTLLARSQRYCSASFAPSKRIEGGRGDMW